MHCLVFTDTDLYSLLKGKAYLANQDGANLRVCEIDVMTLVVPPVYWAPSLTYFSLFSFLLEIIFPVTLSVSLKHFCFRIQDLEAID